tara:strand:+ start:347 stop:511 length:165 start_codon:yes stop_codon:yes gene_type:complete
MENDDNIVIDEVKDNIDNICEQCKKEDESVKQNLIMYSYKICNSCNLSKRIFPL